ncbi:MAG TPA: LysR family transcriptional regulator [Terracidiphilus sp.]|nr:LysR family transcriptional regulator [Terracidiphilus sp.]
MILPDLRLFQAAIALAEELNFSRAGERLRIDQSAVTKRINTLEGQLGLRLFERNHQSVELTEPGRKFVEEAREAVMHMERALSSAHAAFRGADETLNVGTTASADPFLVSALMTVRLPLFPRLKVKFCSDYSGELVHELIAGTLDIALVTDIAENAKLSCLGLAESPYYAALLADDPLARKPEIRLTDLHNRNWVLLSRRVSPHSYDLIQTKASQAGVIPSDLHHITTPEQAMSLILVHDSVALLDRVGAWRIAQNGITMRPLAEVGLRFNTFLAVRSDNSGRLVKEFVRATGRKLDILRRPVQQKLNLTA